MILIGIVRAENLTTLTGIPAVWEGQWQQVERGSVAYAKITSFKQYFTEHVISELDTVFDSEEQYQAWLANDIVFLDRSWKQEYRDYKQAREGLKQMIADLGGYEALTQDEKVIAARWFVLSSDEIDQVLSLEERLAAGKAFDEGSVASRKERFAYAKNLLYNVLVKSDGDNVMGAILQNNFKEMYCDLGQEGTMSVNYKGEHDRVGIFDFVMGTQAGIGAFGYSLLQLITTPLFGLSPQQVIDRCIRILRDGDY